MLNCGAREVIVYCCTAAAFMPARHSGTTRREHLRSRLLCVPLGTGTHHQVSYTHEGELDAWRDLWGTPATKGFTARSPKRTRSDLDRRSWTTRACGGVRHARGEERRFRTSSPQRIVHLVAGLRTCRNRRNGQLALAPRHRVRSVADSPRCDAAPPCLLQAPANKPRSRIGDRSETQSPRHEHRLGSAPRRESPRLHSHRPTALRTDDRRCNCTPSPTRGFR